MKFKDETLNETSRTYSYPSRVSYIGTDLLLTSRDFFVILTSEDIKRIKERVIGEGRSLLLQKDSILARLKDGHVVIEVMRDNDFKRVLMVKDSVFA